MKFAFICLDDGNQEEKRSKLLIEHLEYIESVLDKVVIAGACPVSEKDFTKGSQGSILVYEAETREKAISLFEGDPYVKNNIWKDVKILPWNPVAGKLIGGKTWEIKDGKLKRS
tara:strand:+ start:706 stop:1047 length:342 start_codon:yes stop_codon:yes gene_type:complete